MTIDIYGRIVPTSDELYHFGIKGMHWGIRRFQPYPSGHTGGKYVGKRSTNKVGSLKKAMSTGANRVTHPRLTRGQKRVGNALAFIGALKLRSLAGHASIAITYSPLVYMGITIGLTAATAGAIVHGIKKSRRKTKEAKETVDRKINPSSGTLSNTNRYQQENKRLGEEMKTLQRKKSEAVMDKRSSGLFTESRSNAVDRVVGLDRKIDQTRRQRKVVTRYLNKAAKDKKRTYSRAKSMISSGMSVAEAARRLGVSPSTLYGYGLG